MNNIWFTSDSHFDHENILDFMDANRPFSSVEEMNEVMIERWNEVVHPGDRVYHLGDFQFVYKNKDPLDARHAARLNGQIHLIKGNHDRTKKWAPEMIAQFAAIHERLSLKVKGQGPKGHSLILILDHFPLRTWNRRFHGALHLHGHVHGAYDDDPPLGTMDVGVESWNFYPVSLDEVLESMDANRYWNEVLPRLKSGGEKAVDIHHGR